MNDSAADVWLKEKAAFGPVFLVNAKGFTPEQAVQTMLDTGHWAQKQLNSKLGRKVSEIVDLAADGALLTEIAKHLQVDKSGLRRFTDKLNIAVDPSPTLEGVQDMVLDRVEEGKTAAEIAEELGFSAASVRQFLKKKGWNTRNPYHAHFTIAKGKYLCIKAPGHPACDAKGYVRLHRLIAEQQQGRYLKPDEDVHHIDGNPFNNDPDNLQVMSRAEHTRLHAKQGDCGWSKYNDDDS